MLSVNRWELIVHDGIFSLCHHLIIQYCAKEVGLRLPFRQYALLGDDIVIAHSGVALKYKTVMTESLGVNISPEKSLVSFDTFEFAKRIFSKGHEITAFPISALMESSRSLSTS